MNPILQDKLQELENAQDYECWYLVKQPTAFDSLCYLVSFLKDYKTETIQSNLQDFVERFDATKANLELITEQIKDKKTRHKNLEIFLDDLRKQDGFISEFDPLLWNSLMDYMTVYEKEEVQVTFKNGINI